MGYGVLSCKAWSLCDRISLMKFSLKIGKLAEAAVEAILVFAFEDGWPKQMEEVDQKLGGLLNKEALRREFKAENGRLLLVPTQGKIPAEKVILVGLGKKDDFTPNQARKIIASLAKYLREQKIQSLAFDGSFTRCNLVRGVTSEGAEFDFVQAAVEGILLGSYKFTKYKTEETPASAKASAGKEEPEVTIFVKDARNLVAAKESVTRGEIFSQATTLARDLVNEPASITTPTYLGNFASKLAKVAGFSCKIYQGEDLKKLGMGGLLGVARGSDEPPRFIKLEYKNDPPTQKAQVSKTKRVVLVGKGITFDTGGLSLKKREEMETMKMDMAGAAVILGIFSVISKIRPRVDLIGLIPATENMPGGKALKPGDIVRAHNGRTIEVVNTDAEGRLILSDALSLGVTLEPDIMIDLATLTGSCIIALGEEVAGLFSSEESLTEEILKAATLAGEKFWPMPLEKDYKELLKSEVADLKNVTGKKYGGAITAALFLQEFVDKVPWAHLDIAGPAWQEKGTDLIPKGGSGFGVRTVLNFLQNLS